VIEKGEGEIMEYFKRTLLYMSFHRKHAPHTAVDKAWFKLKIDSK